jgi:hypothetical protein
LALVKFSKNSQQQSIRLGLLGVKLRLDGLAEADALGDGRQIVVAARHVGASRSVASANAWRQHRHRFEVTPFIRPQVLNKDIRFATLTNCR